MFITAQLCFIFDQATMAQEQKSSYFFPKIDFISNENATDMISVALRLIFQHGVLSGPSARLVARGETLQIRKNNIALIHSSLESILSCGHSVVCRVSG